MWCMCYSFLANQSMTSEYGSEKAYLWLSPKVNVMHTDYVD